MSGRKRSLRDHLVRAIGGTFVLRLLSKVIAFSVSIVLARFLGTTDFGVYTYVIAWVTLLEVPSKLGLDTLVVREVAIYRSRQAWGLLRGILSWSHALTSGLATVLALTAAVVAALLVEPVDESRMHAFWMAMPLLPIFVLIGMLSAGLRGLHHVVKSQIPGPVLAPTLLMAAVFAYYLATGGRPSLLQTLGFNIIANAVAVVLALMMLRRAYPDAVREAPREFKIPQWLASARPLLLIGGIMIVLSKTDILMLGALRSADEVGIYAVALRLAALIAMVLVVMNQVLAPTLAHLFAKGNIVRLQRVVTRSAQATLLASLPVVAMLVFGGPYILSLWGGDFQPGYTPLVILSVGSLANASAGSAGLILVASGRERITAKALAVAAVLNVVLNALLIPRLGMNGAAIATFSATTTWNALLAWQVWKQLKVNSTAFARVRA